MNSIKSCTWLLLCFLSWFNPPIAAGKLALKQGHSKSFHGIETMYGWSHKNHTAGLMYVYHLNPYWHTKGGLNYSTGNLLKFLNTYHWNMCNAHESFFSNLLFGIQSSYRFGDAQYHMVVKKWNIGVQLGLEFEQYLSNHMVLVLTTTTDLSCLKKDDIFRYHLGGGIRFTY